MRSLLRPVSFLITLLLITAFIQAEEKSDQTDPALVAPPINTSPGKEYADDTRMFQGIPGLSRAANGRLWALWYAGGTGEGELNYVVLVTSGDDGKTWSGPKLVIDPPGPVRAYDPAIWHDPSGRMWVFWAQSYRWWDGRSGVWAVTTDDSDQENPKWTEPRRLCNGIMMNKPTVLSNGDWLLPVAIWKQPAKESIEHRFDLPEERGGNIFISKDQGKTFQLLGQTDVPERTFDEHMIVERKDNSLWTLVRTRYGIGESISTDDGKTWQGGLLLDERSGVSYPDGVQSDDGTIYIIYDFARTRDKKILMATFTEEDVLAGKPVSDKARLRVLVNQATGTPK